MPSGWTRWILEQFEFPFEVVYPAGARRRQSVEQVRRDHLPVGRRAGAGGGGRGGRGGGGRPAADAAAARREHPGASTRASSGAYTAAQTVPQLKKFLEDGGTILAVGRSAMNLAQLFELPVDNHLVGALAGRHRRGRCRGEVLRAGLGAARGGRQHRADRARGDQPGRRVLRQQPGVPAGARTRRSRACGRSRGSTAPRRCAAAGRAARAISRAASRSSRRTVGKGKLYLFGPEITFRAQPHGTFKFLFNGIYLASRTAAAPAGTESR